MSVPVAFNNQLDKFLDELIQTYPEDKDFTYYKRLIDNLKKFNIRKPIEYFAFAVQKHVTQIQNRDSDFFLNNFTQIVSEETNNKNWIEMPPENQKVIWDYLNVLTKLSMSFLLSTLSSK